MTLSPEEVEARYRELEERRARKRQQRRKQLLMIGALVILGLVLAVVSGLITFHRGITTLQIPFFSSSADQRVTILLLGTDDSTTARPRADAIMLIGFHPGRGEVGVLSIPRDTRVQVPGRGWDRVNAALAYGGPALAKETVEAFLGIKVDYYVQVDFQGFQTVVDRLGGVEMVIDFPMKYDDYAAGLHIDLPAGRHRLNGEQALHYVRYRGGLGDVSLVNETKEQYDGRVMRQLKFVQALTREVLKPETLTKVPMLIQDLRAAIDTDMPLDRMISFSAALRKVDPDTIQMALVPGVGRTIGGASYWVADQSKAREVVDHILLGGREI